MARSLELLELLNTLINTTEDNTVTLNKTTLQSVLTCLQVTQAKVRLLQSLSQLLNDELTDLKNQQPMNCSELVFVQNNPLYDNNYDDDKDDDDEVFNQQPVNEQHSDTTSELVSDKVEYIHEPTIQEFSFDFSEENLSMVHQPAVNPLPWISKKQVQNTLSKPIIRPWEEIIYNKNRTGLGYDKEVTFHIPDYSRPIKFQSAGFLQEASTSPVQVQNQNDKCQHCNRVGHKENQCFDLHPCQHCGKHNHSSDRCSTLKKPARLKIHYEWIDPWKWSSTTKRLYKSYRRIQSRVKTCFKENSKISI
jgi:hypothetical protein